MSSEEKSAGQVLYEGYSEKPKIGWHGLKRAVQRAYEDAASVVVEFSTAPLRERIAELEKQISELKPPGWFEETCDNADCGETFDTNCDIANRPCPQCGCGILRRVTQ